MRTYLLIAIYCTLGVFTANADGIPVVLVAKSSEQVDTTGCNLVKEITRIIYEELSEKRIKIWDSQQKDIAFSISTIQSLEKSAGVRFMEQETMFIYERWTQMKREVTTTTIGFYFAHIDKKETKRFSDMLTMPNCKRCSPKQRSIQTPVATTAPLSKHC